MSKVAVVTGATGGIGSAVVTRLLAEGCRVVACARDRTKLIALSATSRAVFPMPIDLYEAKTQRMQAFLSAMYPRIDLLVCAHGHAPAVIASHAVSAQDFCAVYETDVLGTLKIAQAVYPTMIRHGGSMVFVSSLHGQMTYPARAAYASSKAAVCALARTLALEWGTHGIRVNTVLPWQVEGSRSNAFIEAMHAHGENLREAYYQRTPLRRLIQPAEVADAVLFLAQNPGMNGAELILDGGVSASMWYQGFKEPTA